MNKKFIPFLIAIVALQGLTACIGIGYIKGNGAIVNRVYDFRDFTSIEISNAFGFDITQSDSYSITITAHENLVKYLEVKKSGDKLVVGMKAGTYTNSETRVAISLPELNSLSISGACRGSLQNFKSLKTTDITLSGASQLDLNLESKQTRAEISGASSLTGTLITQDGQFELSGASRCTIAGSANVCDITISGAGNFTGSDFKMQDCSISASGASRARILTSGTLNIEASGASNITYSGEPRIKGLNVTGASKVGSN